jgi:hypothetical protein
VKHALESFAPTAPRVIIYATLRIQFLGETAALSAETLGIRKGEALSRKKLGPLLIAEGLGRLIEAGFFSLKNKSGNLARLKAVFVWGVRHSQPEYQTHFPEGND